MTITVTILDDSGQTVARAIDPVDLSVLELQMAKLARQIVWQTGKGEIVMRPSPETAVEQR